MLGDPSVLLGDEASQAPRLMEAHVDAPKLERKNVRSREETLEALFRFGLAKKLGDVGVHLNDLVVLGTDRTYYAILDTAGKNTVQNKTQDAEFGL